MCFTGTLLGFHTYITLKGKTTRELVKKHFGHSSLNPYNTGSFILNIINRLCSKKSKVHYDVTGSFAGPVFDQIAVSISDLAFQPTSVKQFEYEGKKCMSKSYRPMTPSIISTPLKDAYSKNSTVPYSKCPKNPDTLP